jgi:hypothetical protein
VTSKTLIALSAEVAARASNDCERATARQIERWIEDHLLPPLERRWRGGGGSESSYDAKVVELVMRTARAVDESRSLDEAALLLWMRGAPITKARLTTAYRRRADAVMREFERVAGSSEPVAIAEAAAVLATKRTSELGKQWRRRLRSRRERMRREQILREREARAGTRPRAVEKPPDYEDPIGSILQSAIINVVMVALTGEPSSTDGMFELLAAAGIDAAARDHLPGSPPPAASLLPPGVPNYLKIVQLRESKRRIARASVQDLEQARAFLLLFRDFAPEFASVVTRTVNLPNAFGFGAIEPISDGALAYALPAMVWLRGELPNETGAFGQLMQTKIEGLRALNHLLDYLPSKFHALHVVGNGGKQLPQAKQSEYYDRLRAFAGKHPDDVALIEALGEQSKSVRE